ncbi:MAG: 50S ribosomal protein P1 [Thermoplasmata archaeon]|nr:50S ribosomal protein P1 [Thermoplasmata archaeon]
MEYIYSAMILHSAGKEINEAAVASILKAAGVEADTSRIKALTASLDGVDIEEAMKTAVAAPAVAVATAAPAASGASAEEKKKEEEEEEEVSEEEAAAGLGALFG